MAALRWLDGAGSRGWEDLARLFTEACREAVAGERAATAEQWRSAAAHLPAHRRRRHVLALDGDQAVGAAALDLDDSRPRRAWLMFLHVAPGHRRRGAGSALLAAVSGAALADGRAYVSSSTVVGRPEGARFAERAGARAGLVTEQGRCPTARIDRTLMQAWCGRAAERAGAYSLLAFDGPCPDEHLDAFVAAIRS